jgi:phospholipid/cholesterol/gamma-HCH transport system substrate-binding protein
MKRPTFISWEQLRVGAVILVATLVVGFAMYKLGQSANLFTKRYALIALLPNASGLRPGGQVTIAGQLAGTVRRIEFLPVDNDTTKNLRVTVAIDRRLRQQVRKDSRARLRTMGLLGDKLIDITPGTPPYQPLNEGDTLQIGQSVDYEQLLVQASGAVDDMVALTHDLRLITGRLVRGEGTLGQALTNRALYDGLTSTLDRTSALLTRLQAPNGTIGKLLDDPTLYQNLTTMIGAVDTLVVRMSSNEGTLGRLLKDDTLYTRLVSVASGADSLVRRFAESNGTMSKLMTDQTLYDQLTKSVTELNQLLTDVRRNPKKYMRGLIKVF